LTRISTNSFLHLLHHQKILHQYWDSLGLHILDVVLVLVLLLSAFDIISKNALSKAICLLIQKHAVGLYHVVGPENMSRYQWAMSIQSFFKFSSLVEEDKEALLMEEVIRPKHLELSSLKFRSVTGFALRGLSASFQDIAKPGRLPLLPYHSRSRQYG